MHDDREREPSQDASMRIAKSSPACKGHFRWLCVYHGDYPAADRYLNRADRASDISTQPCILKIRSGHHMIIVSISRSEDQTSRDTSEMGRSRSSCICHGGCLATNRYQNRVERTPGVSTQPEIVQNRPGYHMIIVSTPRSEDHTRRAVRGL